MDIKVYNILLSNVLAVSNMFYIYLFTVGKATVPFSTYCHLQTCAFHTWYKHVLIMILVVSPPLLDHTLSQFKLAAFSALQVLNNIVSVCFVMVTVLYE